MVPRRRPHPGRSLPRRQSPTAPYPARLRTGAATPSAAVVHRRRPPLRGRRRRTAGVRRVPELLQSHPDRREGPHAALRAVSRRVRGGLVGLAVASVRGVGGPPHGWDAGACPDDRTPGPGDGLRVERLAPLSAAAAFRRRRGDRAFAGAARAAAARPPRPAPGTAGALPDTGRAAPALDTPASHGLHRG